LFNQQSQQNSDDEQKRLELEKAKYKVELTKRLAAEFNKKGLKSLNLKVTDNIELAYDKEGGVWEGSFRGIKVGIKAGNLDVLEISAGAKLTLNNFSITGFKWKLDVPLNIWGQELPINTEFLSGGYDLRESRAGRAYDFYGRGWVEKRNQQIRDAGG
jgi:hypothetical protein